MRISDITEFLATERKEIKGCCFAMIWAALVLCSTAGCGSYLYGNSPSPFLPGTPPDHSRDPYCGTGVVTRVTSEAAYAGKVYIGKIAYVDFGENTTPRYYGMTLLVVRDSQLLGKLTSGGAGGAKPLGGFGCNLIEGSAAVGDRVVGTQHQHEYKKVY